jgi:hypothetical protein
MAVKLTELSIIKAAAAVVTVIVGVGRVIIAVAAAAAIYKLIYSYSSLYSINAYQYTHPLKLKFYIEAVQFSTGGGIEE